MSFETIQEFYQLGMWSTADLIKLVGAGVITQAQFTEITGQAYPAPEKEIPIEPQTENQNEPTTPVSQQPTKSLLD